MKNRKRNPLGKSTYVKMNGSRPKEIKVENTELSAEEYLQNRLSEEQNDWCLTENEARKYSKLYHLQHLKSLREEMINRKGQVDKELELATRAFNEQQQNDFYIRVDELEKSIEILDKRIKEIE